MNGESGGEIDGRGGLSDAALLVGNRYRLTSQLFMTANAV
jgi:hypothetical protein